MSDPTNEAELLPCPWCGEAPEVSDSGDSDFGIVVACTNYDCAITPEVRGRYRSETVETWNRRRTPAPCAEPVADALRLDWLEESRASMIVNDVFEVYAYDEDAQPIGLGIDIREAIDAARASTPIASPADMEATNE